MSQLLPSDPALSLSPGLPGRRTQGPLLPRRTQRWQRRYTLLLVASDIVACLVPLVFSWLVLPDSTDGPGQFIVFGTLPVWILLLAGGGAYDEGLIGVGSEEFRRVARAGLRMLAITAVVGLGFKLKLPRSLIGIAIPGAFAFSVIGRLVARRVLRRLRIVGRAQHGVVVVGRPDSALELVARLSDSPEQAFRIARVASAQSVTVDEVLHAVREGEADTVVIASDSGLSAEDRKRLGWELEGSPVDLIVSTDLLEVTGPRIHVRPMAGLPLLHVEQPELTGVRRAVKVSYEWLFSLVSVVLLSPLLLVVALAVKATSRGPALFRQTRVGRHGEPFTVLKFRTMRVGAEAELAQLAVHNEADGPLFKMKDDPRVTRLGVWLRRFSIDELPQLLNVLTLSMSLVGPRPPLPSEVERYGPDAGRRLLVKPGLTGLWQVSGRSDLSWDETIRLDLSYVENWSPALDALILLKTAQAVLRRDGAY